MIKSNSWFLPLIVAMFLFGCKKSDTLKTSSATDTSQACGAPASWFPSTQTKMPDPITFPDSPAATNCDFHQWAWQEFLWLTQPAGSGDLRFMTFPTSDDLFKEPTKTPLLAAALPKHRLMNLVPRSVEPQDVGTDLNPDEIAQAGSKAILVGPNGRIVYYSVFFDSIFYEFVRTNKYYDYATYIKADSNTNYPVGALELKASWRVLSKSEDAAGAYTTQALVPQLKADDKGNLFIDHSKPYDTVTVAMIGLHVVGVVAHHPEFIWATFEHITNAPDLPYGMSTTADSAVSTSDYTFYKAGTKADSCNIQTKYTLNPTTQVVGPIAQVFRQHAWGDTAATTPNTINIVALNKSVHSQLEPGSFLKFYDLIGGVWLLPGALHPNMSPSGGDLHGSPKLANSTMETYLQSLDCFTCHTTTKSKTLSRLPIPPKNMNLSHILTDGLVTRELKLKALHLK